MRYLVIYIAVLMAASLGAQAEIGMQSPYVFTDDKAHVQLPHLADGTEVPYTLATITPGGRGPGIQSQGTIHEGEIAIAPLTQGIHVVQLQVKSAPVEVRFLALDPPSAIDPQAVMRALPRTGKRLLAGQPYRLLSMGDSVTHTGDYETLLVMLLKRATGNEHVTFVDRSYPGRSIDASVRAFTQDAVANQPDVGLVMYGLNDQAAWSPLPAYLEQARWLVQHLAQDCDADTILLQPTPDLNLSVDHDQHHGLSASSAMRTLGFATSLHWLGQQLGVPVAQTFGALWGHGGPTLKASVRAMWPMYPAHYRKPMTSLLETHGRGDTIHPNVLGHLRIAQATFAAMTGSQPPQPQVALTCTGFTRWTDQGMVSRLVIRNTSDAPRRGTLAVYPLADALVSLASPDAGDYHLMPGQTHEMNVRWPNVVKPSDLLTHPYNRYLAPGYPQGPMVLLADFSQQSSQVQAVPLPVEGGASFARERQVVQGQTVNVTLRQPGKEQIVTMNIPEGSAVGRIPLIRKVKLQDRVTWAAAELAYVRYGQARPGEAVVDGQLDEWSHHVWEPVGLPTQARSTRTLEDHRAQQEDCDLQWAFKAGSQGIYLAMRGVGQLDQDRFTLFFDPRDASELGSVGRYYWVQGQPSNDKSKVTLKPGETSPQSIAREAPSQAWSRRASDGQTAMELFIPYAWMEQRAWPESGDLGVSIVWYHRQSGQATTRLAWSEDSHAWTPRWFGVVRRQAHSQDVGQPYMVRVK